MSTREEQLINQALILLDLASNLLARADNFADAQFFDTGPWKLDRAQWRKDVRAWRRFATSDDPA